MRRSVLLHLKRYVEIVVLVKCAVETILVYVYIHLELEITTD